MSLGAKKGRLGGAFLYLVNDGLEGMVAIIHGLLALAKEVGAEDNEEERDEEANGASVGDDRDPEPVEGPLVVVEDHGEDGLEEKEAGEDEAGEDPGDDLLPVEVLPRDGLPLDLLRRGGPLTDLEDPPKENHPKWEREHEVPPPALNSCEVHRVDAHCPWIIAIDSERERQEILSSSSSF